MKINFDVLIPEAMERASLVGMDMLLRDIFRTTFPVVIGVRNKNGKKYFMKLTVNNWGKYRR